MKRVLAFAYGTVCYVMFLAVFVYAVGFVTGFGVPKSLDSTAQVKTMQALLTNLTLLAVFALQHSVMARPAFKRAWTTVVPPPVERSTYVLFTNLALGLMFWLWQPMGGTVWNVQDPALRAALYTMGGMGWLLVLVATFLINHFDLFGMRQVWLYLRNRPYTPLRFHTPGLYKMVRHPLYVGWFMAFWFAPTMTAAHFVFALATTAYILIAIRFEERDLMAHHGRAYVEYRKRVPMLVPFAKGGGRTRQEPVPAAEKAVS